MSWEKGHFSFREQGAKNPPPPPRRGGGAIINVSDLQSRFVLCDLVNKSLFYQAN